MFPHHAGAVRHALVAVWLAAGAAANAVADGLPAAAADAAASDDGGALFNPFAGASAPQARARVPEPERPQADWTLPLLAATAGCAGIGILMRKMAG